MTLNHTIWNMLHVFWDVCCDVNKFQLHLWWDIDVETGILGLVGKNSVKYYYEFPFGLEFV